MAITRPAANRRKTEHAGNDEAADAFISGAPDASSGVARPRGVMKGRRQQITLTIAPALLQKVDTLAAELGQSRAAVINLALYHLVERGLEVDGLNKV